MIKWTPDRSRPLKKPVSGEKADGGEKCDDAAHDGEVTRALVLVQHANLLIIGLESILLNHFGPNLRISPM
jgi:hypothetical protein